MLRTVLLDVKKRNVKVVEVDDELNEYYKMLGCDFIDIVSRSIGGKEFDVMVDDEGLLKNGCIVSARSVDPEINEVLVGNLMFFNSNDEGELVSLSDDDIETIMRNIDGYATLSNGLLEIHPCVSIWS
ncbi:MAG: DUF3846 domain-containing protein [Solobacterium sp.]|nr:DUF3846 domain-containing protein [Solobacterium sp.]